MSIGNVLNAFAAVLGAETERKNVHTGCACQGVIQQENMVRL